jgi:hypothetical protein
MKLNTRLNKIREKVKPEKRIIVCWGDDAPAKYTLWGEPIDESEIRESDIIFRIVYDKAQKGT